MKTSIKNGTKLGQTVIFHFQCRVVLVFIMKHGDSLNLEDKSYTNVPSQPMWTHICSQIKGQKAAITNTPNRKPAEPLKQTFGSLQQRQLSPVTSVWCQHGKLSPNIKTEWRTLIFIFTICDGKFNQ